MDKLLDKNVASLASAFMSPAKGEASSDKAKEPGQATKLPIKIEGNEEEQERLTNIINKVMKTEFGKDTLKIAAKEGYTIDFCKIPGVLGVCNPSKKRISLAPSFTDDRLVGTLSHEMRHAGQFGRGAAPDIEKDSIKNQIMRTRAMEADAQVAAVTVGWELKQQGDSAAFDEFAADNPKIAEPFAKIAEKEGLESGKAQTAAFEGWYDNNRIKAAYENSYYIKRLEWAEENGIAGDLTFEKVDSGRDVIKDVCCDSAGHKTKSYFTDKPEKLEKGKFLDVRPETKEFFDEFFARREEATGKTPDPTVEQIPVRKEDKPKAGAKIRPLPDMENDTISQRQKDALNKIQMLKKARKGESVENDTMVMAGQQALEQILARKTKQQR